MPPRPLNGAGAARETEDEALTRISTEGMPTRSSFVLGPDIVHSSIILHGYILQSS